MNSMVYWVFSAHVYAFDACIDTHDYDIVPEDRVVDGIYCRLWSEKVLH